MIKLKLFVILILCTAFAFIECSSDSKSDSPTTGTVILINNSTYTLSSAYARKSGTSNWGSNLIPSYIYSGGSFTKSDVEPGTYDFVIYETTGGYWTYSGISFAAGTTHIVTLTNIGGTVKEIISAETHSLEVIESDENGKINMIPYKETAGDTEENSSIKYLP
jgi:hypothetical protein